MDDPISNYRQHLVIAEQKAQEDYDKSVLSLSGGAFAISLVFIEKVIDPGKIVHGWILLSAWVLWCFSIAAVLWSYYMSRKALRKAITQCDSNKPLPCQPGGGMARATEVFNFLSGSFFVVGLFSIAVFAIYNLGARHG
jgi:hypothetical protein